MQIRVFTIPLFDNSAMTEDMNAFLRGQKVLTIDRQQVTLGEQAFWTFCVTYIPQNNYATAQNKTGKTEKIDYKEVLDEATFNIFSQLRVFRKQLAEQDAVPAYAVFTDSELAEIAKLGNIAPQHIGKIEGIGQKKVEKYGEALCQMYNQTKQQ